MAVPIIDPSTVFAGPFAKFPELNSLQFHQRGKGKLYYDDIPFFEQKEGYLQPYCFDDSVCIQMLIQNPSLEVKITCYNAETGVKIKSSRLNWMNGIKYGAYDVYQYWGFPLLGEIGGMGIADTEEFVVQYVIEFEAPVHNQIGTKTVFIDSEYYYIKKSHPNTIAIAYTNDVNNYNIYFTSENPKSGTFLFRVEGGLRTDGVTPAGKYTIFQDQQERPVILNAVPYNIYKFTFGDGRGLPNWVGDKLNRIFCCSDVTMDGVQYTRNEGAKVEPVNVQSNYPLKNFTIELRKTDNPYALDLDYVELSTVPFTADTTLVSADNEEVTIDQETITL